MSKVTVYLSIVLSLMIISCGTDDQEEQFIKGKGIKFVRSGGGQKEFTAALIDSNLIRISINQLNFKDTALTFDTLVPTIDAALLLSIKNVLNGLIDIKGDFKQPTAPTGTWSYIYLISLKNEEIEITNSEMRNNIELLEDYVENHVQ